MHSSGAASRGVFRTRRKLGALPRKLWGHGVPAGPQHSSSATGARPAAFLAISFANGSRDRCECLPTPLATSVTPAPSELGILNVPIACPIGYTPWPAEWKAAAGANEQPLLEHVGLARPPVRCYANDLSHTAQFGASGYRISAKLGTSVTPHAFRGWPTTAAHRMMSATLSIVPQPIA